MQLECLLDILKEKGYATVTYHAPKIVKKGENHEDYKYTIEIKSKYTSVYDKIADTIKDNKQYWTQYNKNENNNNRYCMMIIDTIIFKKWLDSWNDKEEFGVPIHLNIDDALTKWIEANTPYEFKRCNYSVSYTTWTYFIDTNKMYNRLEQERIKEEEVNDFINSLP